MLALYHFRGRDGSNGVGGILAHYGEAVIDSPPTAAEQTKRDSHRPQHQNERTNCQSQHVLTVFVQVDTSNERLASFDAGTDHVHQLVA